MTRERSVTVNIDTIKKASAAFLKTDGSNFIKETDAMRPVCAGMRILDEPAFAVGAADNPLFLSPAPDGKPAGQDAAPAFWLEGAKSVISVALPFMQEIKDANTVNLTRPSAEWLNGVTEGMDALAALLEHICALLKDEGYNAVSPFVSGGSDSGWRERYVGYVCGLGTFGASQGLITEKGIAVLTGSIITDCPLPVTEAKYDDAYGYCLKCGKCARNCPVGAIDLSRGCADALDLAVCGAYIEKMGRSAPKSASGRAHLGCGKCQVAVPCASRKPEM